MKTPLGRRIAFGCGCLTALAVAAVAVAATPARAAPGLLFGFSDDAPRYDGARATDPMRAAGAVAVRIGLGWTPGQTRLTQTNTDELQRAVDSTHGMRLIVAIGGPGASPPRDAAAREAFCEFARSTVAAFPSINDVVVWNEPNLSFFWRPQYVNGVDASPADFEALLARCYDVLHAQKPGINVLGPATSPHGNDDPNAPSNISHSPMNFVRKLGDVYRASGRAAPLFDTIVQHVYGNTNLERPWVLHANGSFSEGDWSKLVSTYSAAFGGTGQPVPGQPCDPPHCMSIWYLESGFQSSVSPAQAGLYTGSENVQVVPYDSAGDPPGPTPDALTRAPDQATQLRYAVRLAYCQPYVGAIFNFLIRDDANLVGWQTGVLWPDWTQKPAFAALRDVVADAAAKRISCAPPTPPGSPVATVPTGTSVALTWPASSSALGVTGYTIYRDDAAIGTSMTPSYTDRTAATGATYSYRIAAYDAAGHTSDSSAAVVVAMPPGVTLTMTPPNPTESTAALFAWASTGVVTTTTCSLDAAPAVPCAAPLTYANLAAGAHTLVVTVANANGSTSASYTWTVAPTTTPATDAEQQRTPSSGVARSAPGRAKAGVRRGRGLSRRRLRDARTAANRIVRGHVSKPTQLGPRTAHGR